MLQVVDELRVRMADELDYRVLEALAERGDYALLAMGRTQEKGCFCPVNTLLRHAIETLSAPYAAVLVDAEAGVEQILVENGKADGVALENGDEIEGRLARLRQTGLATVRGDDLRALVFEMERQHLAEGEVVLDAVLEQQELVLEEVLVGALRDRVVVAALVNVLLGDGHDLPFLDEVGRRCFLIGCGRSSLLCVHDGQA